MDEYRSYTVREAAELTGFPERTLRDAIRAGTLHAMLPNGRKRGMRIRAEDLRSWFDSL